MRFGENQRFGISNAPRDGGGGNGCSNARVVARVREAADSSSRAGTATVCGRKEATITVARTSSGVTAALPALPRVVSRTKLIAHNLQARTGCVAEEVQGSGRAFLPALPPSFVLRDRRLPRPRKHHAPT